MIRKNGQFSVEFLLVFVFIMSVVSLIIVVLGNISLDISIDEKRNEVDDFANSILKEFEILQSVKGGYYRDLVLPEHFMARFNVQVEGDYLIVSDDFTYGDNNEFTRYYKIPGEFIFSGAEGPNGSYVFSLCKNFENPLLENNVDFFSRSDLNSNACFDKLFENYLTFSDDLDDLIINSEGLLELNLGLRSKSGLNTLYFQTVETRDYVGIDFDSSGITTDVLEFSDLLVGGTINFYFENATNVELLNFPGNGLSNFRLYGDLINLETIDLSSNNLVDVRISDVFSNLNSLNLQGSNLLGCVDKKSGWASFTITQVDNSCN